MDWPFGKVKKVKCPNGDTHHVYRNPNDAFPLYFKDWASNQSIVSDVVETKLEMASEISQTVKQVLVGIDQANASMQAKFSAVYLAYASNPCSHGSYLATRIDRIIDEEANLRELGFAVGVLSTSVESGVKESIELALEGVIAALSDSRKRRMQNAFELVQKWSTD